jgi:hypothetical protein
MLNQSQNSRGMSETNTQIHAHAPTADSMISEVLNTLKSIDLQHDAELQQLENSSIDDELKNDIRGKLLAKQRERREPYVELLAELRKHSTTSLS